MNEMLTTDAYMSKVKKILITPEEIGVGLKEVKCVPHRLEYSCFHGLHILDDGYNANEKGAQEAIEALNRFKGKRCVVTPGIVECGVMESFKNIIEIIANIYSDCDTCCTHSTKVNPQLRAFEGGFEFPEK